MSHDLSSLPPTPLVARYIESRTGTDMSQRSLLDVGCGVGRNTLAMARLGYESVVGIDTDAEALQTATNQAQKLGLTACNFVQMDATEVTELGQFDVVLGNEIFHMFDKPERYDLLDKIRDATKSNGLNLVSGYVISAAVTDSKNRRCMFMPGELRRYYQSVGWSVLNYFEKHKPVRRVGDREFVDSLANVMALNR